MFFVMDFLIVLNFNEVSNDLKYVAYYRIHRSPSSTDSCARIQLVWTIGRYAIKKIK